MTDMYNKLFTKILDSSVWMESKDTRLVFLTFLAAMDEDGFVRMASVGNVAHRARVEPEAAEEAIKVLESPDANSSDPDNEGRRIERVDGGWMVLNSQKYRALVTKAIIQEQTRERVKRFREKKRSGNATVTHKKRSVTPSEAVSESKAEARTDTYKPTCPSCGVKGSLQRTPARNGYPAGWWCRNVKSKTLKGGGCGENFPLDTPEIVEALSPVVRREVEKAISASKPKEYVSPGMILTSQLKYDDKGMLIE